MYMCTYISKFIIIEVKVRKMYHYKSCSGSSLHTSTIKSQGDNINNNNNNNNNILFINQHLVVHNLKGNINTTSQNKWRHVFNSKWLYTDMWKFGWTVIATIINEIWMNYSKKNQLLVFKINVHTVIRIHCTYKFDKCSQVVFTMVNFFLCLFLFIYLFIYLKLVGIFVFYVY